MKYSDVFHQSLLRTPTLLSEGEGNTASLAMRVASRFSEVSFDAILAWGLVFLLPPDEQLSLLDRLVAALKPEGRLLFTAPSQQCTWNDVTTGQQSVSLGSDAYRAHLSALGAPVVNELDDEGGNHYFSAEKIQTQGQSER